MKPQAIVFVILVAAGAVVALLARRRHQQILAEAELWAVAGADTEAGSGPAGGTEAPAQPARADSAAAGTPADVLPDGPRDLPA